MVSLFNSHVLTRRIFSRKFHSSILAVAKDVVEVEIRIARIISLDKFKKLDHLKIADLNNFAPFVSCSIDDWLRVCDYLF